MTCRVRCCVPFTCRTGGQICKIWYASVRKKKRKRRSSSLHPAETDVFPVVASLQPKSSVSIIYSLLVFSQKKSKKKRQKYFYEHVCLGPVYIEVEDPR